MYWCAYALRLLRVYAYVSKVSHMRLRVKVKSQSQNSPLPQWYQPLCLSQVLDSILRPKKSVRARAQFMSMAQVRG